MWWKEKLHICKWSNLVCGFLRRPVTSVCIPSMTKVSSSSCSIIRPVRVAIIRSLFWGYGAECGEKFSWVESQILRSNFGGEIQKTIILLVVLFNFLSGKKKVLKFYNILKSKSLNKKLPWFKLEKVSTHELWRALNNTHTSFNLWFPFKGLYFHNISCFHADKIKKKSPEFQIRFDDPAPHSRTEFSTEIFVKQN